MSRAVTGLMSPIPATIVYPWVPPVFTPVVLTTIKTKGFSGFPDCRGRAWNGLSCPGALRTVSDEMS